VVFFSQWSLYYVALNAHKEGLTLPVVTHKIVDWLLKIFL